MKKLFLIILTSFTLINLYAKTSTKEGILVKEQQIDIKTQKEEILTEEEIKNLENKKLFDIQKTDIIKQILTEKKYYSPLKK